jgi:putative ABC transport system ATP-binding protein
MTTESPVASTVHLSKQFGGTGNAVSALREVSLEILPGQFTAVMGPSGSGKSTLMNIMAGLDAPTSGRVWLGGVEITAMDDDALTVLRRRRAGFVFQSFNLVPTLDVMGNILLPFELDGRRPKPAEHAWLGQLIDRLGLRPRIDHRPHELSGGQQQRVAIARALATRPAVIFADEPTGNLDSATGRDVLDLLRSCSDDYRQSIVMVSHDPIAASYADRVLMLSDGALVRELPSSSAADISAALLSLEVAA